MASDDANVDSSRRLSACGGTRRARFGVAPHMAIEELIETSSDEYSDGESFLTELDALEAASDAPD